ncbi:MAG: pentapeptide repeat-containing protein [Bacteriovoracaceae bacterium]|nr:pentapeptide repeat-containing protein [Bacteriovoracaceae bacterium]
MKTKTSLIYPLLPDNGGSLNHTEHYEVIENEKIVASDYKELSISGSLFSLTSFKDVTFRSCVFFASKMENCEFINCKFINCKFQFSSIDYCDFHFTEFENCIWNMSPINKSLFSRCNYDHKTKHFIAKESNNRILNCKNVQSNKVEWLDNVEELIVGSKWKEEKMAA